MKFPNWCERGQRCSCWFDGWFNKDWSIACEIHDARYLTSYGRNLTREEVDLEFLDNLKAQGACLPMRWLMYVGVRLFGGKPWLANAPKRGDV